jgi:hypothetical protein
MAEQTDDRIEALTRELSALRGEVETLRARLDESQVAGRGTMRGQTRCPACGATKILFSDRVKFTGLPHPRAFLCVWQKKPRWAKAPKPRGVLQVYICMSCLLVEWYVRDVDGIDEAHESQLEVLTAPDSDMGPYR